MANENPVNKKLPVKYTPEVALAICEGVASGLKLTEIEKLPDMPSRGTIYKWLAVYPKFFDAFERAREVSGLSFEEKALQAADDLAAANDFTGTKVSALNYAMQQWRWTAARRDPKRYGQKAEANTTIPIQINTTLNLGQEGQPAPSDQQTSIYTVEAVIRPQLPQPEPDTDDFAPDSDMVELETNDTSDERPFGLPDAETEQLTGRKPGRPVGRKQGPRKSAAQTKRTATLAAKKLKE